MNPTRTPATGANPSHYDSRTKVHNTNATTLMQTKGGYDYLPADILDQYVVGICTAIHLVQNANKALGKKFSPDFHYLCQKLYYDLNWEEGSSIFNSLKVGNNIGFLPIQLFVDKNGVPYITEADRNTSYVKYIAKLKAIPLVEVQRFISLCTDKLTGYAQVQIDQDSMAKAILASKSGILCRYDVDSNWWTAPNGRVSWATVDIEATGTIRPPTEIVDGHAIGASNFDFSIVANITHPNTWGIQWDDAKDGNCDINHKVYPCTEAWIPYYADIPTPAPAPFVFTQDMHYGDTSEDVKQLQKYLIAKSYSIPAGATGTFGNQTRTALIAFQTANNISLTLLQRYVVPFAVCGPATRAFINTHA